MSLRLSTASQKPQNSATLTLESRFRRSPLREMEELSYREIADVTGVPVGTVMSRLSRGRAELKKVLTALIEKDEPNAV